MKALFTLFLACICITGCNENTSPDAANPPPIKIPDAQKPDEVGWRSLTMPPSVERFTASGIVFTNLNDSGLTDDSISNEGMKTLFQNLETFQGKVLALQGRLRTISTATYTQFDQNSKVLHVALDLSPSDFERILNLVSPISSLAKSTGLIETLRIDNIRRYSLGERLLQLPMDSVEDELELIIGSQAHADQLLSLISPWGVPPLRFEGNLDFLAHPQQFSEVFEILYSKSRELEDVAFKYNTYFKALKLDAGTEKSFYDPSNHQLSLATSGEELQRVSDVIDAFTRHLSLTTALYIPIEFENVTILDQNYSRLIQRIETNRKRISKLSTVVKLIQISERTSYLDGVLSLSKTDGDRELEAMLAFLERQTARTQ